MRLVSRLCCEVRGVRLSQTIYDLIKGWEEILFDKTRQLSHLLGNIIMCAVWSGVEYRDSSGLGLSISQSR